MAVTTRSSLAALPAMLTGAQAAGLPARMASFVLPLSVSTFRLNQAVTWVVMALFAARLYGVEVGMPELATLALTSVLILHAINPDAWIARINLRRLAEGKTFDPDYLARLSADATPALLRHMHEIPADTRETLRARLGKRTGQPSNWRSWNWGREQAANALR